MPQAHVKIMEVVPPAAGKKKSRAIDDAKNAYFYFPDEFTIIAGQTYTVQYEEDHFNGNVYRNLSSVIPSDSADSGASHVFGPPPWESAPTPTPVSTPQYRDSKAKDIFISGVCNNFVQGKTEDQVAAGLTRVAAVAGSTYELHASGKLDDIGLKLIKQIFADI